MKIPAEALVSTTADQLNPGDFALSDEGYWLHAIQDPNDSDVTLITHLGCNHQDQRQRLGNSYLPGKLQILRLSNGYKLIPKVDFNELTRDFPDPGSLVLYDSPLIYSNRPDGWDGTPIWASLDGTTTTSTPRVGSYYPTKTQTWTMHLKHPDGQVDSEPLFVAGKVKAL
jgi:hypothetical protein